MDFKELLLTAVNAAIKAGDEILQVYNTNFDVEIKDDNSPLTVADKNANKIITADLQQTEFPVLSEEGKDIEYKVRKNWNKFWMVDPLDGTKEFVKRNGEFTVNIALIENEYPVMGVIYVPVKSTLYFNVYKGDAYKGNDIEKPFTDVEQLMSSVKKLPIQKGDKQRFTIVGSKSHPSPETRDFIEERKAVKGEVDVVSMGSSLKLCLVAEGVADEYPRFAPTMEWDTAAGQAIAEGSGAAVYNWELKKRMSYNKQNLLNSWFLVTRDVENHYS